jgi:serine/threonine protein kinase
MNTDASGRSGGSLSQERWAAIEQLYCEHELDVAAREALLQRRPPRRGRGRGAFVACDGQWRTASGTAIRQDPADGAGLPPGTRIGPYELLALAGRGGMGEVYRARRVDGALDLEVAIKLLRPDARSAALQRRFMAERAVLARLNHPNIATILDAGIAPDGRPFLALRYVDGVPISAFAATLPLAARLQLFLKVADAVQFAHTNLIVHRDLKPSNILVTSAGEPILLDFGIAKLLGDEASSEGPTHVGEQLLTPSHAAPEQLLGEAVTTATDVHGLGALLFEMLTGCHPYATVGSRPSDVERAILESPAPPPSTVTRDALTRHTIRGDLDSVVQMALRKEPTRRYATAHEFAADVRRAMDGQPVRARPDHWHYRARRFVQRNRVATVAAAAILAITIGALAREVVLSRRLTRERDRAVAEQQAGEDVLAFVTDLFEQANQTSSRAPTSLRVGVPHAPSCCCARWMRSRDDLRVARTLARDASESRYSRSPNPC